jgi:hypothetical protein
MKTRTARAGGTTFSAAEDDLIEAARTLLTVRHPHDGKVVKAPTMGERQAVADAARIARSAAGALERAWEALRRI